MKKKSLVKLKNVKNILSISLHIPSSEICRKLKKYIFGRTTHFFTRHILNFPDRLLRHPFYIKKKITLRTILTRNVFKIPRVRGERHEELEYARTFRTFLLAKYEQILNQTDGTFKKLYYMAYRPGKLVRSRKNKSFENNTNIRKNVTLCKLNFDKKSGDIWWYLSKK